METDNKAEKANVHVNGSLRCCGEFVATTPNPVLACSDPFSFKQSLEFSVTLSGQHHCRIVLSMNFNQFNNSPRQIDTTRCRVEQLDRDNRRGDAIRIGAL